jgi:hypothetical protein
MEMMKRSGDECDKSPRQKRSESKSSRDSKTISDLKEELIHGTTLARPTIKRRNSTGTIYVDTTMSAQDNEATIRCVCAVIRAHMVEAETERIVPRHQYDTFKDPEFEADERNDESLEEREERQKVLLPPSSLSSLSPQVPSLDLVGKFFNNAYSKSQMESECIIMCLIYVERLIKVTKGRFCIRYDNWRPTLFACMILASKVWDDLSMWNVDFSQISPAFDLQRINELELALLDALHYEVKVPAGEYAKYYFHIRSMIARLGFYERRAGGGLPAGRILPLSIEGARKLQLATETYEEMKLNQTETRPRCVSIHTETPARIQLQRLQSTGDVSDLQRTVAVGESLPLRLPSPPHSLSAALEQLIHQQHSHGDGGSATKPRAGRRISDLTAGAKK